MEEPGSPVRNDQRASYTLLLADLEPLIDLTSRSVSMSGFTMETDAYTSDTSAKFLGIQNFARLMAIAARDYASNGDEIQAIELATLPIRLVKRSEQANLITHLIAIHVISISTKAMETIAPQCKQIAELALEAHYLEQLRSVAFPGDYKLWRYGDSVGALRIAAAFGYPVNLSAQTLAGYYRQAGWLYTPKYYQWIIDNLPADDRRVAMAKNKLDVTSKQYDQGWTQRLGNADFTSENKVMYAISSKVLGMDAWTLHYILFGPNLDEAETRAGVALARYDLTQLLFTQRIAELTNQPMPAALTDPFTSAPLPFSAGRKAYYSVGPDKVDQKAAVYYDATNGTLSSGDVLLDRMAP